MTDWSAQACRDFCDQQFAAQHRDYQDRFAGGEFLLLLTGGAPVGRLYLDRSGADIHVIDITLLPSCQGQGKGTMILKAMMRLASEEGRDVVLSVAPDNLRAMALYQRSGFQTEAMGFARHHMRWRSAPGRTG